MKEFEKVRAKLMGYPPGATVPLSYEEIDVLKANSRWEQGSTSTTGYCFGRHWGLEARPGSKLTEGAVIAAVRGMSYLRGGERFRVRCPTLFDWSKPAEPGKIAMITETCESFVLTPELAARVRG